MIIPVKSKAWWKWACVTAWLGQVYLAIYLPEVADEAYYKRWSEDLNWGYFDHPPGVAWWSFAGGRLLNLLLLPMAWFNFAWASNLYGGRRSALTLCLIAWSTPLGLASGVLVTPDAPLLFSWSLAVLGHSRRSYILMTMGLALGLWSKAMIFPAMSGLLYLCWTDQGQQQWDRQKKCLLMSVVLLLLYLPQLYWSSQHEWLPWSFQSSRKWHLFSSFEFIGGQILVGGGLWFIYLIMAYRDYLENLVSSLHITSIKGGYQLDRLEQNSIFDQRCFFLSAPTMITFFTVSLFIKVEANWTALAWPMGLAWVIEKLPDAKLMKAWKLSLAISIPCLLLPIIHSWLPLAWGPPRDAQKLLSCLDKVQNDHPSIRYWVAGRYQEAALLGLELDRSEHIHMSADQKVSIIYRKAFARRRSQYDLQGQHSMLKSHHKACQILWIGPNRWAQGYCLAENISINDEDRRCRLKLSLCHCPTASLNKTKTQ